MRRQQTAEIGEVLSRAGQFRLAELRERPGIRQRPDFHQIFHGIRLGRMTDENVVVFDQHRVRPIAGELQRVDEVRFHTVVSAGIKILAAVPPPVRGIDPMLPDGVEQFAGASDAFERAGNVHRFSHGRVRGIGVVQDVEIPALHPIIPRRRVGVFVTRHDGRVRLHRLMA